MTSQLTREWTLRTARIVLLCADRVGDERDSAPVDGQVKVKAKAKVTEDKLQTGGNHRELDADPRRHHEAA
jgi:hypothetical protein